MTLVLDPADELTRRRVLTGAAALGLLAALPAPGWGQEPGAFPVTIEHKFGATTIPKAPGRVVALIDRDADTLLALGVVPVAIHSRYGFEPGVGPWAADELGAAEPTILLGLEFNYEAIAATRPDLLVYATSGGERDIYRTLSQIAATVALPKGAVPYGATTEESTLLIAEALGRRSDGERVVAELDAYLAGQAAAYPAFAGRKVNYLDVSPGGITSYSREHVINSLMYEVGFAPIERSALPAGQGSARCRWSGLPTMTPTSCSSTRSGRPSTSCAAPCRRWRRWTRLATAGCSCWKTWPCPTARCCPSPTPSTPCCPRSTARSSDTDTEPTDRQEETMSTGLLDRPVITDATRRRFLTGAAAAALLAGRGTPDRGGDAPDGAGGFPVTIDGAFGPTRIERRPARVAAVGFLRDGDDAVALGVTPVVMGVSGNFSEGLAPWTRAALGPATPPTVDVSEDLPLEQVAAARPDLILATDDRTLADHHARLAGIAPVLAYTVGAEAEPWRLRAERIGRALGRARQAGVLVRGIEDRIAAARAEHPQLVGATITSGVVVGGVLYIVNRESDAGAALHRELGLVMPPGHAELPEEFPGRAVISPERLDLLEADVIMLNYVTADDQRLIESSELFKRLDAVRRGSYVPIDSPTGLGIAQAYPSLLSIPFALEGVVPLLAEALAR